MASKWLARSRCGRRIPFRRELITVRGMATAASSQPDDSQSQSWFEKIKSVFVKKSDPEIPKPKLVEKAAEAKPAAASVVSPLQSMASKVVSTVKEAISPGTFTMEAFADELKSARRMGSLAKLVKGVPKNREHLLSGVLDRQERMLRAFATYKTEQLTAQQKAEVAKKCGSSSLEAEEVLAKYYWAKEAHARVEKLKKEGKPPPKNLQEVEALMGGSFKSPVRPKQGRNDACLCGSGKRYKACCGKAQG